MRRLSVTLRFAGQPYCSHYDIVARHSAIALRPRPNDRNQNLALFSESFRLYVLEAAQRENIVTLAREKRGDSTWDSLRLPFFVTIISFLILLFATQKDMMPTTTALATALTTRLPVLMKLVGVFTERRADGKA